MIISEANAVRNEYDKAWENKCILFHHVSVTRGNVESAIREACHTYLGYELVEI